MSTITDKMVGELDGYNMYRNISGMYYFTQVVQGYFINRAFDDMQTMKDYILSITEPNSL
jgi:hypothetical protein